MVEKGVKEKREPKAKGKCCCTLTTIGILAVLCVAVFIYSQKMDKQIKSHSSTNDETTKDELDLDAQYPKTTSAEFEGTDREDDVSTETTKWDFTTGMIDLDNSNGSELEIFLDLNELVNKLKRLNETILRSDQGSEEDSELITSTVQPAKHFEVPASGSGQGSATEDYIKSTFKGKLMSDDFDYGDVEGSTAA